MTSLVILIVQFIGKIIVHINHPIELHIKLNDIYHKIVLYSLRSTFKDAIKLIKNNYNKRSEQKNPGIIWIFWWQGYKQMPSIVRCCIRSIQKNSNGHRIILVSKKNVHKYASLPNYIYNKLFNGTITLTHFSDILRFNLLKNHGGLWIDSTMYCTEKLGDNYFSNLYTSGPGGKLVNKEHDFISDKWTGFLIGGCINNPVFVFMDTFFNLYWKRYNHLINYFLIDYALYYVYIKDIGGFKEYVNNIAYKHNLHLHWLMNHLNDLYDETVYKCITKDTNMFKLTYKMNFDNHHNTFYKKIIDKYL